MSLNPARYLKMDHEIGSIEVGKKADLVAFTAREDYAVVTNLWVEGAVRMRTGAVLEREAEAVLR
jgi:alpha-D-ribose 1-methylphosphonate 5-triphosphate diphosphatase